MKRKRNVPKQKAPLRIIYPDVIVLGVGRSGTSFVAGILHNHFGVCMGHQSSNLPFKEYYEDKVLFNATIKLCGRFGRNQPINKLERVDDWLKTFSKVHANCKKNLYGLKVKHMCWIAPEQLIALKPRLIVRTDRDLESIARSFFERNKKKRSRSLEYWRNVVNDGEEALQRLERQVSIPFVHIPIPMRNTRRMGEDEVVEILKLHIEKLGNGQEYQYNLF